MIFCAAPFFSDPMLASNEAMQHNLINAITHHQKHAVIGIFSGGQMIGLFSFLALADEKYLEMLVGLSREQAAYSAMLAYLQTHYAGYQADFVFNPSNQLLLSCLKQHATFETEQQKMVFSGRLPSIDTSEIQFLSEAYIPSYLQMHTQDVYWTGDKVIAAKDQFRIFIALEGEELAGYLDVTHCFEENEPFDLLVKPEHRRKGYGKKLMCKALEMNRPHGMMLLVDVDNVPAMRLYESIGFEKVPDQNSLTAHLKI